MPEDTITPIASARYRDVRYPNFVGGAGDPNQPGTATQPNNPATPAPTAPGGGGGGGTPATPRTRLGRLTAGEGDGKGLGDHVGSIDTPENRRRVGDAFRRGRAALTAENVGKALTFGFDVASPTGIIKNVAVEAAEELTGEDIPGAGFPQFEGQIPPDEEIAEAIESGQISNINQAYAAQDAKKAGGFGRTPGGAVDLSRGETGGRIGGGLQQGETHTGGGVGPQGDGTGRGDQVAHGGLYAKGGTVMPVRAASPRMGSPELTNPARRLPAFLQPPMVRTQVQRGPSRRGYEAGGTVVDPASVPDDGFIDNQPINADEGEFVITRDAAVALGPEVLAVINDPQMAPMVAQLISEMIGGDAAGADPAVGAQAMPPAAGGAQPRTRLGNLRA